MHDILVTQILCKGSVIVKKYLVVYILIALLVAVQSIGVSASIIENTSSLQPTGSNSLYFPSYTEGPNLTIGSSAPAIKQPSDPYDSLPSWVHDCENHTHFYPDQALSAVSDSSLDLYVVLCRTLNVRPTPGTQEARIGKLHRGDTIQVISIKDGWAEFIYEGKTAYVSEKYIAPIG